MEDVQMMSQEITDLSALLQSSREQGNNNRESY